MDTKVKLGVGIAIALLFIIIAAVSYFTPSRPETAAPTAPTATPPPPQPGLPPATTAQTDARLETIMRQDLPILGPEVEIAYSHLIKKFYVYKKSAGAEETINNFIERNRLQGLMTPERIIYTNGPALLIMFADEKRLFPNHPDTKDEDI